jgi:hydrogenase expression/formation protein HypE
VVAVLAPQEASAARAAWQALPAGASASIIGTINATPGPVVLRTPLGGRRVLPELDEDALPRIC